MAEFTRNERRRIKYRAARMGWLDDGRRAFPAKTEDTEFMAQAIFNAYDPDLVLTGQELVEWCPHTTKYQYEHDCADWCERPVPKIVWVAEWPK